VNTAYSGPKRSGAYTVSTTEYQIDPLHPIEMLCTCDECFLKAANCKAKYIFSPLKKMSDQDKINWFKNEYRILQSRDIITIDRLLGEYIPGIYKIAKSNPMEYVELTRRFHSPITYIPVNKVANLDPLAFMSTYSLPNRAFAQKVSEIAKQYIR
jgi:hypothetical protein